MVKFAEFSEFGWNSRIFLNLDLITVSLNPLKVPTPQNGQTHSNNSSATSDELVECV